MSWTVLLGVGVHVGWLGQMYLELSAYWQPLSSRGSVLRGLWACRVCCCGAGADDEECSFLWCCITLAGQGFCWVFMDEHPRVSMVAMGLMVLLWIQGIRGKRLGVCCTTVTSSFFCLLHHCSVLAPAWY